MSISKKTRQQPRHLRDEALEAYLNREDFHFDLNGDALYRYYKDRYVEQGKKAMQDTMGQAATLTGGYGSSYAQNVGQRAYQKSLQQLGDVVPALYQLAYDRYRDEGETLYQTYQNWAQLEQEAADREDQDREYDLAYKEYELEERKRQDENTRSEQELYYKTINDQRNDQGTAAPPGDYYAWLAHHQGKGPLPDNSATEPEYDNGKVSAGSIMTMQRVLGLQETGKWTDQERSAAGELNADDAWLSYQKGQLQNRKSVGLGLPIGSIKTMERVLGLEEDGYWSGEDQKAAGGRTSFAAWKDYQQGKLQSRSKTGMTTDAWAAHQSKQSQYSGASKKEEATPAVERFIACMVTEDQAAERGVNPTEWKMMVVDRLNRVSMTMDEFEQLEKYYGLDIEGGTSGTTYTADASSQKMSYAEYREKTAVKKVADLNAAVQLYFNVYQAFANSAVYDMQYIGYNNAASMLEKRNRTAKELRKRADTLSSALRMNGDIITGDYGKLLKQIAFTKTGVDSIMDAFSGYADFCSNYDTEEAYNQAVAQMQWQEKYEGMSREQIKRAIATLPDGDEKTWLKSYQPAMTEADYEYEIANVNWTIDRLNGVLEEYRELTRWEQNAAGREREAAIRNQYGDLTDLEELIGETRAYRNRLEYQLEGMQLASVANNEDFAAYKENAEALVGDIMEDAGIPLMTLCEYMKPDEIAIYCYHYFKNGKNVAERYLNSIREIVHERKGQEEYKSLQGNTLQELFFGLKAGFYRFVNGISNSLNFEDEYIPRSSTEFTSDLVREDLSDIDLKWYNFRKGEWDDAKIFGNSLGQVAYDASTTVGNMAPSMLASAAVRFAGAPVLGKIAGSLMMGGSAVGNAYQEKLNLGYDKKTARSYSLMIGASEVVLEKMLGGITKLGGGNLTNAAIKNLDKVDNVFARFAKSTGGKLLMNAGSEAFEEGLQSVIEPYLWEAVSGEEASVDWEEALYGALMGFATGGLFEGVDMAIDLALESTAQHTDTGKTTMPANESMDALINSANEVTDVSSGQMQNTLPGQIDKVSPKLTDSDIGQPPKTVQTANNQENTSVNQEDVTKILRSKDVSSKKADGIADAIVARLNGQKLTRHQRNILRSALDSPTVQSVISEFMQKKADGIDSAKNNVYNAYDKDNTVVGLANSEEAALWDLAYQGADAFSNHDDATVTEAPAPHQVQNTVAEETDQGITGATDNIITDGSHLENGKLKPNVTYKTGEHDYFYTTNEDGLIVNARTDDLQSKTHEGRLDHNPNTYGKKTGDHAGHLFGDRFGGSPELDNLVSQAKRVNLSEFRKIENQWAKALKKGKRVQVNIDIHYDQGGVRPSLFDVSYTINGKHYNRKISNQLGGSK